MAQSLTAIDLLPLIARLPVRERERLVQLISAVDARDAALYAASPPREGEFTSDEEGLAWEAEGWDETE